MAASPMISALSGSNTPSAKKPRFDTGFSYDQIYSISKRSAETKDEDTSDSTHKNTCLKQTSILEEELFSPLLTERLDAEGHGNGQEVGSGKKLGGKGMVAKKTDEDLSEDNTTAFVEKVITPDEEEEASARLPPPEQEFNPYLFMKLLPPYDQVTTAEYRRRRLLPPQAPEPPLARRSSTPTRTAAASRPGEGQGAGPQPEGHGPAAAPDSVRRNPGWTPHPERPLPPTGCAAHRAARPTLVLDLDETLVHCTARPDARADLTFPVRLGGGGGAGAGERTAVVRARKRPHLDAFLRAVGRRWEVVVFTAARPAYARALLDRLDPRGQLVEHRLFRGACLPVGRLFLKDLARLGRDLRRTVLVDDSPHAYALQPDNGVPILGWRGGRADDDELRKLLPFLDGLAGAEDVRPVVRRQFGTRRLVEGAA